MSTTIKTLKITPLTPKCTAWLKENVVIRPYQMDGKGFQVDLRFAEELLDEMQDELTHNIDFALNKEDE
jgi:hypothetical protein